ncbi:hypothetical protein QTL97_16680 [Sporosarcina thermotolerans]|uniref:Lipoprotein n=1 Tax=Sporosarcina thermotolerans TaxID=633404 RepID=A0AAW9AEC1_9BACL|nr:hypothetical protein [Sporosarcina thermotolerans]MDW0118564.1 hypothetical protein [Sporosarcina thermotolerans]WHT49491.1 hypothetical protein QNH10_08240 [Sporosarcina thermotolerans]
MKSKMKYGTLVFSLFMLLLLMGCDPFAKSKTEFYDSTKSTNLSEESVNSVALNSTANDVTGAFGKPIEVNIVANPKSKYLVYEGIEFGIIEDKVISYYFNNNYQTTLGIKTGDTKENVIQAYGENFYERVESGLDTIGYFDKENMINLEIGFKENKIVLLMIKKIGYPIEN